MTIRPIQSLVAAVLIFTSVGAASANYPHSCCRWIGIGWSDGYHSHYGCPPKPHQLARQAAGVSTGTPNAMPWWMNSAPGTEQLPTPAPTQPANDSSVIGQGVIRR